MRLIIQPIPGSPYFDVVDVEPRVPGTRVIRAAYMTYHDAETMVKADQWRAELDLRNTTLKWIGVFALVLACIVTLNPI